MTTIYRLTISEGGTVTKEILYSKNDQDNNPEEMLTHLKGDNGHYERRNYTLRHRVGHPIADRDFPTNISTTDVIDISALEVGDEDKDAVHILVVGPYQNEDELEKFLFPHSAIRRIWVPRKEKHFDLWDFITHPGTWSLVTLALILIGIFVPFAAPGLILAATISIILAAVSLYPYIDRYKEYLWSKYNIPEEGKTFGTFLKAGWDDFKQWAKAHRGQVVILGVCIALLITAIVLIAGFFTAGGALVVAGGALVATGGGGFAFMAPVFAAIAAPFAVAATTVGAEVSLAALAGASFVLAALCIPDTLRRIADFLGGFVVDLFGPRPKEAIPLVEEDDMDILMTPLIQNPENQEFELKPIDPVDPNKGVDNPFVYVGRLFKGVGIAAGLADSQYHAVRDKHLLNDKSLPDEVPLEVKKQL